MKNRLSFFLAVLLLVITSLSAERSVICGNVKNSKATTCFFAYNQSVIGYKELKQPVTIDAKGNFKFVFSSPQMHVIYLYIDEQYTSFYLQPGDSLVLKINYLDFDNSIVFSEKGADKNNFKKTFDAKFNLGHEQDIFQQTAKRNAKNFKSYCDSLFGEQVSFTKKIMGDQNKIFTNYFIKTLKYKFAESKLEYPGMWAYLNRLRDTIPAMPYSYFNFLKELPLNSDTILSDYSFFGYLSAAMRQYENYIYQTSGKKWTHKEKMDFARSILNNEKIMLAYESSLVERAFEQDFVEAQKIYLDYEKRNPSSIYLSELKEVYTKIESISPGHRAPAFILSDENGKKHDLNEFKGKLIYLDFWASWCGPCIMEMPSSKKIRKEFEGKNLVFLYISIDEDVLSWKEAIKKYDVNGVNLIAPSFEGEIAKLYNITGVPSYFLIGRDGKIIDNSPPRPSDEEALKKTLTSALEK